MFRPIPSLLISSIVILTISPSYAQVLREDFWVPNAAVHAVAASQDRVYIAGSFDFVGKSTGALATINLSDGAVVAPHPAVVGSVNAILADGAGGWFIGGDFARIFGATRHGLARVDASGNLTPWNPSDTPGTVVRTLLLVDGAVYVGGSFVSLGGAARQNLGAVDATTGIATAWNPSADFEVNTLIANGSTIYAGGSFGIVDGQPHRGVVAIDASGDATSWNPQLSAGGYSYVSIDALAVFPPTNMVIIGGTFDQVGPNFRSFLAGVDATTGALILLWNPNVTGPVFDLFMHMPTASLVVAGAFAQVNGQTRPNLAIVDPFLGFPSGWNPSPDGTANTLTFADGTLYVGGNFHVISGQPRERIAALTFSSGAALPWNPGSGFTINAIGVGSSTVYAGGDYTIYGNAGGGPIGGQKKKYLAAFDAATGTLISGWNPNPDDHVYALALNGNTLYAAGRFSSIGGQYHPVIAAIDATTGALLDWEANPIGGIVTELILSGNSLYVLGEFVNIGGQFRHRIAELDAATGLATLWYPNQVAPVTELARVGNTVYVGGYFSYIGGQARNHLAALDATTANATDWSPNPNYVVQAITTIGNRIFVGGEFTSIAGQPRNFLAAFENDVLLDWNPGANQSVYDLEVVGNVVYASGIFSGIGNQQRLGIGAIDGTTGDVTNWSADTFYGVGDLFLGGGSLYASGGFRSVNDSPRSALVVFSDLSTAIDRTPSVVSRLNLRASPNPFGGDVSLVFDTTEPANVEVDVYDVAGRLVRRLHAGSLAAGEQRLSWDGRNDAGNPIGSGTYFVRVRAGSQSESAKVLLIR